MNISICMHFLLVNSHCHLYVYCFFLVKNSESASLSSNVVCQMVMFWGIQNVLSNHHLTAKPRDATILGQISMFCWLSHHVLLVKSRFSAGDLGDLKTPDSPGNWFTSLYKWELLHIIANWFILLIGSRVKHIIIPIANH